MDTKEICDKLTSLCQLDIDAIHAYDQAIDKVDIPDVRSHLEQFRNDHHQHVSDLSNAITQYGGQPPEFKKDFKGYLIQGFTNLRSMMGNEAALKAMRTNEELTNRTYDAALSSNLPVDAMSIVRKNREDERRHLDYINRVLKQGITKAAA